MQEYLDYVRSLGIEAWVPDTPGNGPKMSVPDQCRSRVLCLEYEGTEIYIRGDTRRTINYVGWRNNYSAILGSPNRNLRSKFVTAADYEENKNNARHRAFRAPILDDAINGGLGGGRRRLEIRTPLAGWSNATRYAGGVRRSVDDIEYKIYNQMSSNRTAAAADRSNRTDKNNVSISQRYFSPEMAGVQFKRVVCEKLTREVRVAKQYVSSLPYGCVAENPCEKTRCNNDKRTTTPGLEACKKGPTKGEKYERGFVRRLVERFDANDNDNSR